MKSSLVLSLTLTLLFTSPKALKAESVSPELIPELEISQLTETKQVLIQRLIEVTEQEQIWEQSFELMFNQFEENFPAILQGSIDSNNLSSEEQQSLAGIETNMSQILLKFQERLQNSVTFDEMLERVYYPLYDRYFTVEELQDLLAFYDTPTGKKTVQVMPQLLQESVQLSNQIMLPRIIEIVQELIQEELPSSN